MVGSTFNRRNIMRLLFDGYCKLSIDSTLRTVNMLINVYINRVSVVECRNAAFDVKLMPDTFGIYVNT